MSFDQWLLTLLSIIAWPFAVMYCVDKICDAFGKTEE